MAKPRREGSRDCGAATRGRSSQVGGSSVVLRLHRLRIRHTPQNNRRSEVKDLWEAVGDYMGETIRVKGIGRRHCRQLLGRCSAS